MPKIGTILARKKNAFFVTFFPTHYGSGRERGRDASAFLKAI